MTEESVQTEKFTEVITAFGKLLLNASETFESFVEYEELVHKHLGENIDPLAFDKVLFDERIMGGFESRPDILGELVLLIMKSTKQFDSVKDLGATSTKDKREFAKTLKELGEIFDKFKSE